MWQSIQDSISVELNEQFTILDKIPMTGGDIHTSFKISTGTKNYFIKINDKTKLPLFQTESYALALLANESEFIVPEVICLGATQEKAFLLLEYIEFVSASDDDWYTLGEQLAVMHQDSQHGKFGWQEDNYIGLTPQPNNWSSNWRTFFAEQRIGWQLQLLSEKSVVIGNIDHITQICHDILTHHYVKPSLIHGDLWQGNIGFCDQGPVLYDPACYYGDRETDIAMTELFGQFPSVFYQGYQETFPLPEHYEQRKLVYNFYHVLNHANLFGDVYITQAKAMVNRLLSLN